MSGYWLVGLVYIALALPIARNVMKMEAKVQNTTAVALWLPGCIRRFRFNLPNALPNHKPLRLLKPLQRLPISLPDPLSIPLANPLHKPFLIPPLLEKILKRLVVARAQDAPRRLVRGAQRTGVAADFELVDALGATEDVGGELGDGGVDGAATDQVDSAGLWGQWGLWGDEGLGAEAEGKELRFEDCAGVVVGRAPGFVVVRVRLAGGDGCEGFVLPEEAPCSCFDVGDNLWAGEEEGQAHGVGG